MQSMYLLLVFVLSFCTQFLHAFTDEEIQRYNEQSFELLHNDRARNAIDAGDLEKLHSGFSDFSISILDARELRILRNMYFAQYGYRFRSSDLKEWFGRFDWYKPRYDNVDDILMPVDTIMIGRIKLFESAHTVNRDVAVAFDDLVGIWHASPIVAAGYCDLLYFFPDGRFEYSPNQMDWSQRLQGMYGTWRLDHNRLTLLVESKGALLGGEIVEPTGSCASEFAIEGGQGEVIDIDPPEKMIFPISNIVKGEFEPYPQADTDRIDIGSHPWWRISTDPFQDLR